MSVGMLEGRLLVQLGDHVHAHRGLGRIGAPRVPEAEVAMGMARAQDLSHEAVGYLREAVETWIRGGDPAPAALRAFWDGRLDRVKLNPSGFRLHLCAPASAGPEEHAFYFAPKSPHFRRDGDLQTTLRVSHAGLPEDVVVWSDGFGDLGAVVDLVQPGCTLTVVRPRRAWWMSWAGVSPVSGDRIAGVIYTRFNMAKVYVGDDPDFELVVMGVEGAREKNT